MNPWLIGGGAVALLLLAGGAKARTMSNGQRVSDRDLDALADMLMTETTFKRSRDEMAQIVWIAVNRARNQGKPIWFVVQPGRGPRPVWNTGEIYRKRFEAVRGWANWPRARVFVEEVLAGQVAPNLGKTSFVHPAAMPKPPCASNRVQTTTRYGQRCLPSWVLGGKMVGTAMFV